MGAKHGSSPISKSLFSRVVTRIRLWRPRFKGKARQQDPPPHTGEGYVSDALEVTTFEFDEYLGTPIALTSPSYSLRSSMCSGAADMDSIFHAGRDPEVAVLAHTRSFMSGDGVGPQALPCLTVVDADGVMEASGSPEGGILQAVLEVYSLLTWVSVTDRFGPDLALNQLFFKCNPNFSHLYSTGTRRVSYQSV